MCLCQCLTVNITVYEYIDEYQTAVEIQTLSSNCISVCLVTDDKSRQDKDLRDHLGFKFTAMYGRCDRKRNVCVCL